MVVKNVAENLDDEDSASPMSETGDLAGNLSERSLRDGSAQCRTGCIQFDTLSTYFWEAGELGT